MEKSIFPRPEVLRELKDFVEVRLHTDRGGKDSAEKLEKIKEERLNDVSLPIYEIVDPETGKTLGAYKGADLLSGGENFRRFLADGLAKHRALRGGK